MFDNSGKVYISVEDLAVRRMYVDPDRLLFMFDQLILIFKINDFFLPSSSNSSKSYTVIRRYDRLSGVTVGRGAEGQYL